MTNNSKILYRKVNKTSHNGFEHATFGKNERSSWSRHTKRGIQRGMNTQQDRRGHGLYDYTPLFKFLLKQEGRDWDEIWKECTNRLNTTEPILYMVHNIKSNGLVRDDINISELDPSFCYGEGASYSSMYVDENNKLQFVNKDYVPSPSYENERRWGETFNGRLYETYKRPKKKIDKMKSYIKPKE